jgi:hypothetical protein
MVENFAEVETDQGQDYWIHIQGLQDEMAVLSRGKTFGERRRDQRGERNRQVEMEDLREGMTLSA